MALRLSNAAEKFLTPAGTSAFAYHGMSCVREVAIADLESARRTVESDWANQPFAAQSAIVQAGRDGGQSAFFPDEEDNRQAENTIIGFAQAFADQRALAA